MNTDSTERNGDTGIINTDLSKSSEGTASCGEAGTSSSAVIGFWTRLVNRFTETSTATDDLVPRLNRQGKFTSRIIIPGLSITGVWATLIVAILFFYAQMKASSVQIEKTTERIHEQMVLSSEQSMQAVNDSSNKFELAMKQFEGQMNTITTQFEAQTELVALLKTQIESQMEISQKQFVIESFTSAINQLQSDMNAVVLGGVHILDNLAKNNPEVYGKPVYEILCSVIKDANNKGRFLSACEMCEEKDRNVWSPAPFVKTILDILFRNTTSQEIYPYPANLSSARLIGVNLDGVNLQKADLRNADFGRISLRGANLQGADLTRADLHRASLNDAIMQGADLSDADLHRARLFDTNLQETNLQKAHLQRANLWGADLRMANLRDAKLQMANLCGTKLQGRDFVGADFRGVQSNNDGRNNEYEMEFGRIVKDAIENDIDIKTDLSGIRLYDDEGNELLDLTEDERKQWFIDRGANVDDLPATLEEIPFYDLHYQFEDWYRKLEEAERPTKAPERPDDSVFDDSFGFDSNF
ncbi:MAG: pentapeptide repeat-containing protein [Planctomycetaceae bacterium]|nr:pentapeptide repeat-containing protein [Planctomycetaceae bacterium]